MFGTWIQCFHWKSLCKTAGTIFFCVYLGVIIYSCGGSGGDSSTSSGLSQGVFLDSPVSGITYNTETNSGTTNSNGTFFYNEGEIVHFMLGDVPLGQALASSVLTPIDIVPGATNTSNPTATNMIRFMQTMDVDGNPNNGITISEEIRAEIQGRGINFNMSIDDFEQLMKSLDSRPFSLKTMINEHAKTPSGGLTRTTRHCLWADVFKELNATDIGKIMLCDTDFPSTKSLHPKLRLERTKTIMQGDDYCDFVYHWDD